MNLTAASSNYDIEKKNYLPACLIVTDSHPEEGADPKGVQVTVLYLHPVLPLAPLSL